MRKQRAIEILGGTQQSAATCVGVVNAAIRNWPDPLNPVTRDRVIAAIVRMHIAPAMGLTVRELHDSKQAQAALEEALAASPDCLRQIGHHAAEYFKGAALAPAG
jgi:hypothetical protein